MQTSILLVRLHVHWLIVLSVLSVCHDHPALHIEFLVPNNAFDRANFSSLMWMLEILSCSYQVNILIELCYFHETSQTFEICLKKNCVQIHTDDPLSYESRMCFIASAVDFLLRVCVFYKSLGKLSNIETKWDREVSGLYWSCWFSENSSV